MAPIRTAPRPDGVRRSTICSERTRERSPGAQTRYYACAGNRLKGCSACGQPLAVPEPRLDRLVISAIADQLLTPDRLTVLLREAIRHRRALASGSAARRSALLKELRGIEAQIDRLLSAVAEGTVPDPSLIRKKLDDLDSRREQCVVLLRALDSELPELRQALSKRQAASVAGNLKRRLLEAPRSLQKRYVHGLVSEIVVGREQATISGPRIAICRRSVGTGAIGWVRTFVGTCAP